MFLGLVLLCGSCLAGNLVGGIAPEITVREWITSNPPDVKNLQPGVYVIEFWATWCPPCRENVPHLRALTDRYRGSGLQIIALSQDKSAATVKKFVQEKKINYHVAVDNGTAGRFGVKEYPTVLVVSHKGRVIWQGQPWEQRFEQAIGKAIKDAQPPLVAKKT